MLNNFRILSLIYAVLGTAHVLVLTSAEVVPGAYVVQNVAFPTRVMDENRQTHTVNGWIPNGGANQKWLFTPSKDSKVLLTIQNCETKRYLRSTGSVATTNTTVQFPPRVWLLSDDAEGRYSIDVIQDFTRGLGLTGNNYGDAIKFEIDAGSVDQKWRLEFQAASC